MPIYEYRCEECGELHEALQQRSDPPLTDCPACGRPALKKRISAAGFRLKGTGWYATDFKGGSSNNKPADTGGDSGSDSGGDSSSAATGKTDSTNG